MLVLPVIQAPEGTVYLTALNCVATTTLARFLAISGISYGSRLVSHGRRDRPLVAWS